MLTRLRGGCYEQQSPPHDLLLQLRLERVHVAQLQGAEEVHMRTEQPCLRLDPAHDQPRTEGIGQGVVLMLYKVDLDIEDGKRIRADSLQAVLEKHTEIEMVVLFWCFTRDYYTSNASIFSGYVQESQLDEEYSLYAGYKDALEYSKHYDQWDGHDFMLLLDGRVLYGYYSDHDPEVSWNDGYDHHPGLGAGVDPSWIAYIVVDRDHITNTEYLIGPDPLSDCRLPDEVI